MRYVITCAVIASLCLSTSYASWQNPVFLSELNDYQNGYVASWPTISSDANEIIFVRSKGIYFYCWQAKRNPQTGVFDQQRLLSELNSLGGQNIFGTWLSKDSLRLYYCADDPKAANNAWGRNLCMAIRKSPADKWVPLKKHMELQLNQYISSLTLTSDELNIIFSADNLGTNYRIFAASRPSVFHNFSNIKEVSELEALGARSPNLSLDGLTVYFVRQSGATGVDSWVGSRQSLNEPFGNFESVTVINSQGDRTGTLYPSWDGKKVYYSQRQGVPGDLNAAGIFVSEWVDDSFPDVIANLQNAMEKKQRAIRLLDEASAQERTAANLLTTLPPQELPAYLTAKKISDAMKNIEHSLAKEAQIIPILEGCVRNLQVSLFFLLPPPQP